MTLSSRIWGTSGRMIRRWGIHAGLLSRRNRPGGRVLLFHGIVPCANITGNTRFLEVKKFEALMRFMKEHFHVVHMNEYLSGIRHPQKLTVTITFDDGYRNNLQYAIPILRKYQIPATFFITAVPDERQRMLWPDALDIFQSAGPKFIEFDRKLYIKGRWGEYWHEAESLKQRMVRAQPEEIGRLKHVLQSEINFADDQLLPFWELLAPDEIATIAADSLFTIGSHGITHASFLHLNQNDIQAELNRSKAWLEDASGKQMDYFAFPYGHYNPLSISAASSAGYSHQFMLDYRHPEVQNHSLVPRLGNNPGCSVKEQVFYLLKGKY